MAQLMARMRMPEMRRAKMFRYARPTKFRFNKSTRLETRVTESPVGTFRTFRDVRLESGMRSKADVCQRLASGEAILVRCYWIASCPNWDRYAPSFPSRAWATAGRGT